MGAVMSTTYTFDALILTERFNSDWSEVVYTLTEGPVDLTPPGDRTGFAMAEWGIEYADYNGAVFSFETLAFGPVTDDLGDENPAFIQIFDHAGGQSTCLVIDRHIRGPEDNIIGFDVIVIPVSGAPLPDFADGQAFADWRFATPQLNPTDVYPVGTVFVWEDFDNDTVDPINGTTGPDTLAGTDQPDIINGLGGNDLLRGEAGNDELNGGGGADKLEGGPGSDTLNGGAGNDILRGGTGNETDIIDGGEGSDTVDYSDLTIGFQAGGLTVNFRTGTTSGSFYVGQDQLASVENANGTNGADTLIGNAVANRLNGLGGNDLLNGGDGNDSLDGGAGRDMLLGGNNNDMLVGRAGADRMEGGNGADSLSGGDQADTLIGGAGRDSLTGGLGADAFVFNAPLGTTNVDLVTDFGGADLIHLETDIFSAIGVSLTADEFKVIPSGTSFASVDATDRLIYQKATGKLFYDADGSGSGSRVLFAQVTAGTVLALDDFLMV